MNNYNSASKLISVIILIVLAIIYSLPNLYGEQPALQIKTNNDNNLVQQMKQTLIANKLPAKQQLQANKLLFMFDTTTQQLQAKQLLQQKFPNTKIALHLANKTPLWLSKLHASPMKLGLDLRGGVHFLLNVDIKTAIKVQNQQNAKNIKQTLRQKHIRAITARAINDTSIQLSFANQNEAQAAQNIITKYLPNYQQELYKQQGKLVNLTLKMRQEHVNSITDYTLEKTINTINNRINELGVSEAAITRNGNNQISVDLPGIQDTVRAKSLLGKTATLYFHLVDHEHDPEQAVTTSAPIGSQLYYDEYNRPILLKEEAVLTGDSITYASMQFSQGRPAVSIKLGGGKEAEFHNITSKNIGKALAVVYVDTEMSPVVINNKTTLKPIHHEKIISVATIQSALGQQFEITGLNSIEYADNLALLLRSGALAAPVNIIQELTIGPSLGQNNIDKGTTSLIIGSLGVIVFMLAYYRLCGLIANLALTFNVLLIIAALSLIDATLTLPGIAGIVLTVGMAVDANVLINERIREEIRLGLPAMASIKAGYERAFSTILDSNITTLIVAMILFTLGSGTIKGFAITLTIGIIASMFTSIVFTRIILEFIYSNTKRKISIGI